MRLKKFGLRRLNFILSFYTVLQCQIREVLLHGVNSKDFEFEDLIIPLRSLHTDFALIVGIMENLNEDLRIDSFEKRFMTHIERQLPVITT